MTVTLRARGSSEPEAVEKDCSDNTCGVEVKKEDREVFEHEHNLNRFCDAIERDLDLEIAGTNAQIIIEEKYWEPDSLFMIRNKQIQENCYGAYVKIPVIEVMNMPAKGSMHDLLLKIKGEKNPRSLENITRIVGYYSRVNNWNKSKIGELRDRANGRYGLTNEKPAFQEERQKAINNL